ncbi:MAG: hypothetical protein AAGA48_38340 [Myxococcota bacterium]
MPVNHRAAESTSGQGGRPNVGIFGVLLIGCEQPLEPETRVFTRDGFDAPSKLIEEDPNGRADVPAPIPLPATWCAGDSLCDIRVPNAWEIEQFNLAQGVDVPRP